MVHQTCNAPKLELKKPNREPPPPPAPPLPPKDVSPAHSNSWLNLSQAPPPPESCYSEGPLSVKSVPNFTKYLQPNYYCQSSARSDYEYGCIGAASDCGGVRVSAPCRYATTCCRQTCLCEMSHHGSSMNSSRVLVATQSEGCQSCANSCSMQLSRNCGSQTTVDSVGCQSSPMLPHYVYHQQVPKAPSSVASSYHSVPAAPRSPMPPVPQERKMVARPKLSISPKPQLKRSNVSSSTNGQPNPSLKYQCEPLSYRLHIEQNIERIFRYLRLRQSRLEEHEKIIQEKLQVPDQESMRRHLAIKETKYLRSLRRPLNTKDFKVLKNLGAGFIGSVTLVKKLDTNDLYAMKKLRKSQVFRQDHMAHVMAERDILAEADNEWIVKLYYSFQDESYLYFILEYTPGGDLMGLLARFNVLPESWARFYIAEISLALQFVHDMNFIHRDIKPDNILIDAGGHIKLADFGLCTGYRWTHDLRYYRDDNLNNNGYPYGSDQHQHQMQQQADEHPTITGILMERKIECSTQKRSLSLVGSTNYIAPEVLRKSTSNERLRDWWSVGVILYEMVVGYCPFIDLVALREGRYNPAYDPPDQVQMRTIHWKQYLAFPSDDDSGPPKVLDSLQQYHPISETTKYLIKGWLCEPRDRLCQNGIQDIKDHPFFRNFDWNNVRRMTAPYVPQLSNREDTSHFEAELMHTQHDTDHGGTMIAGRNGPKMAMNDFTYRAFSETSR